jgi:hypothetical protein
VIYHFFLQPFCRKYGNKNRIYRILSLKKSAWRRELAQCPK